MISKMTYASVSLVRDRDICALNTAKQQRKTAVQPTTRSDTSIGTSVGEPVQR